MSKTRDDLLRSLDRIRTTADKLENELIEFHNVVRFDYRSPGASEQSLRLETEMSQLAAALRQFREHFQGE